MTTVFRDATGVEPGELGGLFGARARPRPAARAPPEPPHPAHAAAPRNGFAVSTPDSAAFALHLGRALKTAAPLLAADVLSLAGCGVIAEGVLRLVHPHAGPALGWLAPVA